MDQIGIVVAFIYNSIALILCCWNMVTKGHDRSLVNVSSFDIFPKPLAHVVVGTPDMIILM